MKCPSCKEPDLVMSERAGVEIDYCPSCRGIWLDRGELDKILDRARQEHAAQPAAQQPAQPQPTHPQPMPPYKVPPSQRTYRVPDSSDDYSRREWDRKHGGARRKSWWMEIFD